MKTINIKALDLSLLPDGYAMGKPDTAFIMLREEIKIENIDEELYLRDRPLHLLHFVIQDHKFKWDFSGYIHEIYKDPSTQELSRIMLEIKGPFIKNHLKRQEK